MVNLGSAYATRGRLGDAVRLWVEASQRAPGLEAVWIKLGSAHIAAGRDVEARQAVSRCLFYHPDSEACLQLQADLNR